MEARIGSATLSSPAGLSVDGDEQHGLPLAPQLLGARGQRLDGDAMLGQKGRIAEQDAFALRPARRRPAGERLEILAPPPARYRVPLRRCTTADASGCSLPRSRLAARRSNSRSVKAAHRLDDDKARLALGQRAGLVHDQRVGPMQHFERLGVADQHAGSRRRGRCRP